VPDAEAPTPQAPADAPAPDAFPEARAAADALLQAALEKERVSCKGSAPVAGECAPQVPQGPQIQGTAQEGAVERSGGTGEFGTELVAYEVKKRLSAMRVCYQRALGSEPTLQGTVVVAFTLEPKGTVSSATAAAGADARLAACAADTVKRFRFNPGPTGGSASYRCPITFLPR
jgi:TonB family protein